MREYQANSSSYKKAQVPSLDLSFNDYKDQQLKKGEIGQEKNGSKRTSTINYLMDQSNADQSIENFRRMGTDKSPTVSNQKNRISPQRNPQSYQYSQSIAFQSDFNTQSNHENKPVNITPNNNLKIVESEPTMKTVQKQQQPEIGNFQQQLQLKQNPQSQHNLNMRVTNVQSQGIIGNDMTLDYDSYEKDRYIAATSSLQKDEELFEDSAQVSAIQNSVQIPFDYAEEYKNQEDEDTSARRLLPGESPENFRKASLQKQQEQIKQKVDIPKPPKITDKNFNSTSQGPGPVKSGNKVVPMIQLQKLHQKKNSKPIDINNAEDEAEEFEFDESTSKNRLGSGAKFKPLNTMTSLDFRIKPLNQMSFFGKKETQDLDIAEQMEQSCLLDESMIKKHIEMPNVLGNKMQVQGDIGHKLTQNDDQQFHLEFLMNAGNDDSFYRIIDKDSIEVIDAHLDRFPCLNFRKSLMKIKAYIHRLAVAIITNSIFETVSIIVIIANSIFLALDDPMAETTPVYQNYSDTIFQALYTVEMVLKIMAMGFFFNEGAYLRDSWNILDFVIVCSGYVSMFLSGGGANLSVLRSFRVIRPLRTISSIQGLRVIVSALVASLPLLRDTILVLLFFFIIFAIAGVQLFQGVLKNRCVYIETGVLHADNLMCAITEDCPAGYFCGKRIENPNFNATSFDNVLYALMLIFQTVTLEGWTTIMIQLQQCVATWVVVYFIPIVFIGAFFLLNLTLAVIKSKFTEEHQNKKGITQKKKSQFEKKRGIDESSEEELTLHNNNNDPKLLLEKEIQYIKDIEKDIDIPPERKRQLKDKFRIEQLLKKLDCLMKEREISHNVATNNYETAILKKRTKSDAKFGSSMNKKDEIQIQAKKMQRNNILKKFNYGNLFNLSLYQRRLSHDIEDNNQLQVNIDGAFMSSPEINEVRGGETNEIKEAGRVNNFKIQQMIGIKGFDKKRDQYNMNRTASPWLGEVFSLERQVFSNDRQRQQPQNKVVMSGIAGIKNKRYTEEDEIQENMRKAAYEKLQENFDIFEFLDNVSADQFGDDELSDNDQDGDLIQKDIEIENQDSNEEQQTQGNGVTAMYEKKTTYTTIQEFKYISNRTSSQQVEQQQNEGESSVEKQGPESVDIKFIPKADNSQIQQQNTISSPSKNLNSTFREARKKRNSALTIVRDKSRISNDNESPTKIKNKEQGEKLKLIQRFLKLIKRNDPEEKARRKKQNELKKKQKANRKAFLRDKSRYKRELQMLLINKNQNKSFFQKLRTNKSLNASAFQSVNSSKSSIRTSNMSRIVAITIRAKSEQKKKEIQMKDLQQFKTRETKMQQKRNEIFAHAVRNIGKTKEEIQKDKIKKLKKARLTKLTGIFEWPKRKDLPESFERKKFIKSASFMISLPPLNEINDTESENDENRSPLPVKIGNLKPKFQNPYKNKNRFLEDKSRSRYSMKVLDESMKIPHVDENDSQNENVIPNLEDVLKQKKKKIALKLKNYKFTSTLDVFEQREDTAKLKALSYANKSNKIIKKKKLTQEEKQQLAQQKKLLKKNGVKAYQKKILFQQKKYMFELMEDDRESDENQDDAIRKLEEVYDVNHRSDIHVTGTLSIVFDKPKTHTKIMNPNYYANIQEVEYKEQDSNFLGDDKLINVESLQDIDKNMTIFEHKDRSSIIQSKTLKTWGFRQDSINQNNSGLFFKAPKTKRRKHGMNNSKMNQQTHRNNKSEGPQKLTTIAPSPQASRMSQVQQSSTSKMVVIPRPLPMSDKQILKRLNNEMKRSSYFNTINFRQLPETIKKSVNTKIKGPQVKKSKKKNPMAGLDEDDEIISDTTDDREMFDEDYFLDREYNMQETINKARDESSLKGRDRIEWSGQEIMPRLDPYKARIAIASLNRIRVWPQGTFGYFKRSRTALKNIMKSGLIENFMTLCVFANTIILSMDHYGIDPATSATLSSFNTFFTIIFSIEMFLKIIAIGLVKWLNDKMNYMDGAIVLMSLVEMAFLSGNGALSAFRSVRMFRTLRVLRVARLLRGLKSMMNIISVIQRSIESFVYLGMLLFLFIFIFALLGMQLFGGQFTFLNGSNRYNFDSFDQAFVTSFILLSMENWNTVMYYAMNSTVNKGITCLYFISCIFIGNFMLLNLFLAILLDAFTTVDEEDHDTPEKKAKRDKERIESLKVKKGEDLVLIMDDVDGAALETHKTDAKKKKKKKKAKSKILTENNMLDESIEIDMETLATKKEEASQQKKQLFDGIECNRSIYLFSKGNLMRIYMYKIITNQKFEHFILVLIVLSSIKLVMDTYFFGLSDEDMRVVISGYFDLIFTVLFTGECLFKVIAFGFVQDQNSYLRETWSQLDFFIVVTSLIDACFANINIPAIRILRLLRILRPLRFISHNSSMKTVVIALLSSMGGIFNVGIVVVAVFLMFSILGVNLFAGKLQYCTVDPYIVETKVQCFLARGEWKTKNQNFDNVLNGMITLFGVATLEGWPDVMYSYTDITAVDLGPLPGYSAINAYFFVGFVFIGAFFFMNLFVGVLFMNFEAAQKDETAAMLLDKKEIRWVDMIKMIISTKPEIIKVPKNKISQFIYKHTKAETKFDFFIMICIILNMIQMAINFEGQPDGFTKGLEATNYLFTSIFAIEAMLKLIANGPAYFNSAWNQFDFFVVCASFIDIVMGQLSTTSLKFLRVAPQLARVLRVLRVSRLFRLLNKYKGLQALIQTITFSLPSLMNVFALLMLVYFIFSVLAVFMFRQVIVGQIIDPVYMNFSNFGQAIILLIRISTGEDWPTVMFDTMNTASDCIQNYNCGVSYAPVFFIPFIMVCSYVMLNLFIMIIIQQFEMYYLPEDNTLQKFRENLEDFKRVWSKYAEAHEGVKIRMFDLVGFFKDLKGDLGMHGQPDNFIFRNCVKMNLESDEDGFIYFNELLFKTMKRIYGYERTKKKKLMEIELHALEKLIKIKENIITKTRKRERYKAVTVNPFLAVMYKNMSFNAWKQQFCANLVRRNDEIQFGLERESDDEEYEHKRLEELYEYVTENDISVNSEDFGEDGAEQIINQNIDVQQSPTLQNNNDITPRSALQQDFNTNQNLLEDEIVSAINGYSVQRTLSPKIPYELSSENKSQKQDEKMSIIRGDTQQFQLRLQKTQRIWDNDDDAISDNIKNQKLEFRQSTYKRSHIEKLQSEPEIFQQDYDSNSPMKKDQ